jgi:hypothetical protein
MSENRDMGYQFLAAVQTLATQIRQTQKEAMPEEDWG